MSDPAAGSNTPPSMQFERAERPGAAAGLTCGVCTQPVRGSYYEVNGQVTCETCRSRVVGAWHRGSSGVRFGKALGLGFLAAAAGAGLYFGIEALTGYEFGLVAVVVGLMVGTAVRKGSQGRGGWRYQLLAMFLTYSAVVATDSTMIAREFGKQARARADSLSVVAPPGAGAHTQPDSGVAAAKVGPGGFAVGLIVLILLAYAAPIMIGIAAPLHLLIAGFALYEAWKLNKGSALRVTGPYRAAAGA